MKRQSGFTLIELVMVIVILGILAATALPKFVNLAADARVAAMKAVEGSMRATNSIIYAKANIGNAMGAASAVTINGVSVATQYGFAKTVSPDLVSVMDVSLDFASAATTITHTGATNPATCSVTYTVPPNSAVVPVYTLDTTGC